MPDELDEVEVASAMTSGNITIESGDTMTVTGPVTTEAGAEPGGDILLMTDAGSIMLMGPVTADTSGEIDIDAFETVHVHDEVMSGSGNITVRGRGDDGIGAGVHHAGSSNGANTDGNITTTGVITVLADASSIDMAGDDSPDNNAGSTMYNGSEINLAAAEDVRLGVLNTVGVAGSGDGSIRVVAGISGMGGSIYDDNGNLPINITSASTIALAASGTIGSVDPLDPEFTANLDPIEVESVGKTYVFAAARASDGSLLVDSADPTEVLAGTAPVWITGTVPGNELFPLNDTRASGLLPLLGEPTDGLLLLNWMELGIDGPSQYHRVVGGVPYDLYRAATGGNIRMSVESLHWDYRLWQITNAGLAFPQSFGFDDVNEDVQQPLPAPELWSIEGRGIRLPNGVAKNSTGWGDSVAMVGLNHNGQQAQGAKY